MNLDGSAPRLSVGYDISGNLDIICFQGRQWPNCADEVGDMLAGHLIALRWWLEYFGDDP
jgi:hypothetical protein